MPSFLQRGYGTPNFGGLQVQQIASPLGQLQAAANILATPARIQATGQQAALDRAVLMKLGLPEAEARRLVPEPAFQLPGGIAGKALAGLGSVGSLISTVLGSPIAAPRVQMGPLLQGLNLQHSREMEAKRQSRYERTEKRQEQAAERAERAEQRYQEAFEHAKEQDELRAKERKAEAERAQERIGIAQGAAKRAEEAATRAQESHEAAMQKFGEWESPAQKTKRERQERLDAAKAHGLDLDDPEIGVWVWTGKQIPTESKREAIRKELEARRQGSTYSPALFGDPEKGTQIPDDELRRMWGQSQSDQLSELVSFLKGGGTGGVAKPQTVKVPQKRPLPEGWEVRKVP